MQDKFHRLSNACKNIGEITEGKGYKIENVWKLTRKKVKNCGKNKFKQELELKQMRSSSSTTKINEDRSTEKM